MGGYGSGRYGYSTTAKLDEGLNLNINKLRRDGALALNFRLSGILQWTRVRTGEEVGSTGYEVNTLDPDNMWMRLHYNHTPPYSDDPVKRDYKIGLTTTQPNYGGKRLWFICPLTSKRAGVLYCPPGSLWFASRQAYNLKYQSQSKGPIDRAIDRKWKLINRLGGQYNYYTKPKGMHRRTHERKMQEIWEAEEICDAYLARFIMERTGALGP